MRDDAVITHDLVQARVQVALRLFVGRARAWSVAALAEATGIDQRTLRAWVDGETTPSLSNFLVLARVLGPAFAQHVIELAGLGLVEPIDAARPDGHGVMADSGQMIVHLASALADGTLDHCERATLAPIARGLAAKLTTFAVACEGREKAGGEQAS